MNQFRADFQRTPNTNSINSPSHTYIDIDVNNNNTSIMSPLQLQFNQTKNTNIINDCSQYHLSVIRFAVDSIIPVIIPEMNIGGTNIPYVGTTKYSFQLGIGSSVDTVVPVGGVFKVVYEPDINYAEIYALKPTTQPATMLDVYANPYFYLHSVKSFLALLNNTLVSAVINAKTTTYAEFFKSSLYPQFIWDTSTNKINLYVPNDYIQPSAGTVNLNTIFIGISPELYYLLNTFPIMTPNFLQSNNSNTSLNYIFKLENQFNLNEVLLPSGDTYFKYSQEASSVSGWSPVSSIVFSSYTIPVNTSGSGVPEFFGLTPFSSNSVNNISNFITDFEIPLETGLELSNSVLYYTPQSEYRLFDINSNEPLSKLQLSVFWKSKLGSFVPFMLKHGGNCSLKLMFRKKDFQTSYI
jgi:hypothetical protein